MFRRLLFFCLISFVSIARAEDAITLHERQIKALGIVVLAAEKASADSRRTRLAARVLLPDNQMRSVAAPLGGRIVSVGAVAGQAVKTGEILARISGEEVLALQRRVENSARESRLLSDELARSEALFAEGLISQSRLLAVRAKAEAAVAEALKEQKALAFAGVAPSSSNGTLDLRAPFSGIVLERTATLGAEISAGAQLYLIARPGPFWLEAQVPPALAKRLESGARFRLADSGENATLLSVGQQIDQISQSVLLLLATSASGLYQGQIVEIEPTASPVDALRIPLAALVSNNGKTGVFVAEPADLSEEQRFVLRQITLKNADGNSAEVSGIAPDDLIVVQGAASLKAVLAGIGSE